MEYQNPQPSQGLQQRAAPVPVPGPGRTVISETAVAKVAGIAARSVPGVYSLGSVPSRALGAIRDAVGSSDHAAGVRAEVGETQVAVDISLVASYGTPLHSLANQVRAAVYRAVEELVGEVAHVLEDHRVVRLPRDLERDAGPSVRPLEVGDVRQRHLVGVFGVGSPEYFQITPAALAPMTSNRMTPAPISENFLAFPDAGGALSCVSETKPADCCKVGTDDDGAVCGISMICAAACVGCE